MKLFQSCSSLASLIDHLHAFTISATKLQIDNNHLQIPHYCHLLATSCHEPAHFCTSANFLTNTSTKRSAPHQTTSAPTQTSTSTLPLLQPQSRPTTTTTIDHASHRETNVLPRPRLAVLRDRAKGITRTLSPLFSFITTSSSSAPLLTYSPPSPRSTTKSSNRSPASPPPILLASSCASQRRS